MRRRNFTLMALAATLIATLSFGLAFAAEEESPWKVRRPADNTVLPSEYVHRPGTPESMPGEMTGLMPEDAAASSPAPGSPKPTKPEAAIPPTEQVAKASEPAPASPPSKPSPAPTPSYAPAPADAGRVGQLQSVSQPSGVVLFLPLDRTASEPRSFRLKEPARLVFDLSGSWVNGGSNVYRLDSPWVEKVVMGRHEEFMRMVVYLNEAAGAVELTEKIAFTPEGMRVELIEVR